MPDNNQQPQSKSVLQSELLKDYIWDGDDFNEATDNPIYRGGVVSSTSDEFVQKLNQLNSDYSKKAAVGFDGVYSPYSTFFDTETGLLPHFETPTNKTEPNSLTLNPFNPNNALTLYYAPTGSQLFNSTIETSGSPTTNELSYSTADTTTIVGTGIRLDGRKGLATGWLEYGHNIEFAVKGTGDGNFLDFNDEYAAYQGSHVEVTNLRGVGLRAPMVLTGWGFDVDGKPVPADTEDAEVFASGAFSNPSDWKSGPLDVRWDDERKVWAAGTSTKIFLVKTTNVSNPPHFSYEVDRSDSRSQFTRFGPDAGLKTFDKDAVIHDPENIAYTANTDNVGAYEQLNYGGIEYPYYEAFIIRETKDETDSNTYYNIWTDDCNDCGHITNSGCGTQHGSASKDKKILIENPLRQSLEVGDLAFTVKTGRKEKVNTGTFSGGSGTGASGQIVVDQYGVASGEVLSSGSDYSLGAIGIVQGDVCIDLSLAFTSGVLNTINIGGVTTGFSPGTYPVDIISTDAIAQTEELDIHWILQAEFKSQQIVTHVECEGGLLQSCSMKIQTQGFKTCEWCGEDTTFINAF
jgi:hypothetical protein